MEINDKQLGELIIEGKTKKVYGLRRNGLASKFGDLVYINNKDDISAGDNSRNHRIMEGKGRITVETSSAIFQYFNALGIETAFVSKVKNSDNSFVAKRCQMIPIEIVIRRIAFGTYLKLNPNVEKGFKFIEPEIEIHIKDDANHDPLWSLDRLLAHKFNINGLLIDENCMKTVFKISKLVFEILERVWHSIDYQLVDLKVEFGVTLDSDRNKRLILADIIDNETWRLWPKGDQTLMVDKQIYRQYNEGEVDDKVLDYVKNVFQSVSDLTQKVFGLEKFESKYLKKIFVYILAENQSDLQLAEQLSQQLFSEFYIIETEIIRFNKSDEQTNKLMQTIEAINQSYCQVIVTIGINGSLIKSNTAVAVIDYLNNYEDICLSVAKILATNNPFIWSKIRVKMSLKNFIITYEA